MTAPAVAGIGLTKPLIKIGALIALLAILGLAALTVALVGLVGSLDTPGPASPDAITNIPAAMLTLYQQAGAATCPTMPWQVLAAIGTVETDNDQSTLPGVHSGANYAGAEGPMQFEPATFAAYNTPVPPGGVNPPDIYDPVDAVYAAGRMLCADGAGNGDLQDAVFAYNHSQAYVDQVLTLAVSYGMNADGTTGVPTGPAVDPGPGRTYPGDPQTVITYALGQLGVPYLYGGESPGVGLDCSALVQLSYQAAGIALPRTTFAQATYGITVPATPTSLQPGDLLFFEGGDTPPEYLGHVALYLGGGLMIQAPYTGTDVSISPVPYSSVELARRVLT